MKRLAKKMATCYLSVAAFGVEQIVTVVTHGERRAPEAAFDAVSRAALRNCAGTIREVYEVADKVSSEMIETGFWVLSRQSFGGLLGKRGLGKDVQSVRALLPGFGRAQEAVISLVSIGRQEIPKKNGTNGG